MGKHYDIASIKQVKSIGWDINYCSVYSSSTKNLQDFLRKKAKLHLDDQPSWSNTNDPSSAWINFLTNNREDYAISRVDLHFKLDQEKTSYFNLRISCSGEAKKFAKKLDWEEILNISNEENAWVSFRSPELSTPKEVEKILDQIMDHNFLPATIIFQLRLACGLPLINKQRLLHILNDNGYEEALKLVPPVSECPLEHDQMLMMLGDACQQKENAHALDAYKLISKNNIELYQRAHYQIASILLKPWRLEGFQSEREQTKASLSHYMEAVGFLDSEAVCKKLFNYVCCGSYNTINTVPFPIGANTDTVLALSDFIYDKIQCEKHLLEENQKLRDSKCALSRVDNVTSTPSKKSLLAQGILNNTNLNNQSEVRLSQKNFFSRSSDSIATDCKDRLQKGLTTGRP